MEDTFSNAIVILLVGMLTVFFILVLVMWSGNLLIQITNRLAPIVEISEKTTTNTTSKRAMPLSTKKLAAISAVISKISGGTSRIEKIEKLD